MQIGSGNNRWLDILLTATLFLGPLLAGAGLSRAADFVDLVRQCESCHGKDGNSTRPDVPIIAGFSHVTGGMYALLK